MLELIEANWLLLTLAFLVGLAIAWYVFRVQRRTRVRGTSRDVLDEGAEPARRNQALIDAKMTPPPAAAPPPSALAGTTPPPPSGPAAAAPAGGTIDPTPPPVPPARPTTAADAVALTHNADDLTRLKGLGPKLAGRLNELGVTRIDQIAAWTDADIDRIDPELGRFSGRIRRDRWVEQARLLIGDDGTAYQSEFGRTP
jgi:predicted flap endonuclease-1-like 5' DNA nuclease